LGCGLNLWHCTQNSNYQHMFLLQYTHVVERKLARLYMSTFFILSVWGSCNESSTHAPFILIQTRAIAQLFFLSDILLLNWKLGREKDYEHKQVRMRLWVPMSFMRHKRQYVSKNNSKAAESLRIAFDTVFAPCWLTVFCGARFISSMP
jgi:hypothetical protein